MKYYVCFIFIGCVVGSLGYTNDDISSQVSNTESKESFMYHMIISLLKTCDRSSKKIFIFDNVFIQGSFQAIAELQPQVSASLFSNEEAWKQMRRYQFNDIQVDTVVLVIDVQRAWNMMKNFFSLWHYNRNCTIYIFPTPLYSCTRYRMVLELIMRFYFSKVYYICQVGGGKSTFVYTHDPYGDTRPSHWNKISQGLLWGKNWTFYSRPYSNDMSEQCSGFHFERTDPSKQSFVVLGLRGAHFGQQSNTEEELFNDQLEEDLVEPYQSRVIMLKKLLKLQFKYYTVELESGKDICPCLIIARAYDISSIDAIIFYQSSMNEKIPWNYIHPFTYEPYAIISHDRGLMTPLEKIAKFYGIWTLLSCIIVIIIIFIVIWMSTNNISLAVFDVLRLFINTGIFAPINTFSLKIFFSMVFLYFLVIQATFSGHLAEFLTKVDYRCNIETLADLNTPRIKEIYQFVYRYDNDEEFDVLRKKSTIIIRSFLSKKVINNTSSACIAPLTVLERVWAENDQTNVSLYISKNTFDLSLFSSIYRPGFPWSERFNWAYMFLFDTGMVNKGLTVNRKKLRRNMTARIVRAYIDHRKIKISDLYFAIVLLIAGCCVGSICFLLEISINHISNKFQTKQHRKNRNVVNIIVESRY